MLAHNAKSIKSNNTKGSLNSNKFEKKNIFLLVYFLWPQSNINTIFLVVTHKTGVKYKNYFVGKHIIYISHFI